LSSAIPVFWAMVVF